MPKKKVTKKKVKGKTSKKSKSGKKMPSHVLAYFKYRQQGMSKVAARKKAGMPAKSGKAKKKWGPGHPLYDWQHKKK